MILGVLTTSTPPRLGTLRRVGALLCALIAAVVLVLGVLGVADFGRLVVLRTFFSDPFSALFLVLILTLAAVWLGMPVRSEADDRGRARTRIVLIVFTVLSLLATLFVRGHWFVYDPEIVAHAPAGDRVVAKVRQAASDDSRAYHVHLFSGTGLGAKDLGDFGAPCGDFKASFAAADELLVTSVYGDFHLHFDPATGAPRDHIGISCAAG